jgi:hypothetical protein
MPFPSLNSATPPQYILDAMGGGYDSSKYYWNPDNMSLVDRYTGGSLGFGDVPDPSQGTQLVTDYNAYNASNGQGGMTQLAPGSTPYFGFGDSAQDYGAGLMPNSGIFASTDPAEIAAYKDRARTTALQGVAKVGALVGGAALGGSLGGGAGGELSGVSLPSSAVPLAPTAAGSGTLASTLGMAAPASGGALAGIGTGTAGALAAGGSVMAGSKPMDWLGIANIGSSLLGALGANKAAGIQSDAANASIEELRRQYEQNRADQMPWLEAGRSALGRLQDPNGFQASPDYEFRRNQGMRGIGNYFGARGGAFSGNALKALNEYNSNLASGEFGNWFNRQASMAGLGQATAQGLGAAGANNAANIGNSLMAGGNARASGLAGVNNAVQGGLQNAVLRRYLGG